jgi:S-(hydroxymethyl)glutathione dehydrogenase/alcohol dehydrogenase
MKTQAWVLTEINKLELLDIELPPLEEGQALVEIHYTSICGSQLNEIAGNRGPDKYIPHLLGHEGLIRIIDAQNKELIGKHAIATWIGKSGKGWSYKGLNAGPVTTFSKHSIIDLNKLIILESAEILPEMALLGCAIPTGAGSFLNFVQQQEAVLGIIGLGGVGLTAGIWAKNHNYSVYGLDISEDKTKLAESLNIQKWNDNIEYDYILECSGSIQAMEKGFNALKKNGKLLLAGNAKSGLKINIDPFEFIKGKEIKGIVGGQCDHNIIFHKLLPIVNIFRPLIFKIYSLENLNIVINDMKSGKITKPMIQCF